MLFKLPLAYLAGVRVHSIEKDAAIVSIRHRWLNQNPFKSVFWAAQGMAAEIATAVLVMKGIESCGKKVSMLVINQRVSFTKKATGTIQFECLDGTLVSKAMEASIKQTIERRKRQNLHNEENQIIPKTIKKAMPVMDSESGDLMAGVAGKGVGGGRRLVAKK